MMMALLMRRSMRSAQMTKLMELRRIRMWKRPRTMMGRRSLPLTMNRRLLLWTRHCSQGATTTKTLKKLTSTEKLHIHICRTQNYLEL